MNRPASSMLNRPIGCLGAYGKPCGCAGVQPKDSNVAAKLRK
jgi:hypothetical protein